MSKNISESVQQLKSLAAASGDVRLQRAVAEIGDLIQVGNITNASGVAIGHDIRMVVNHLNVSPETVAALLALRNQASMALGVDPNKYRFDVEGRTEGFVGRQHVFKAIEDFLTGSPGGYLMITADPGMGKTTLLAEYFLADALGSVRQMTNSAGDYVFAQSYDPYGVVTYTAGTSQTEFGFTGEQYGDSTQLLFLRARFYNPADGRFQSRDTWGGDVNNPLSLNRWMYVEGNPVNLTDPSGHDPWWCDNQSNPELCYAKWIIDHGGRATPDILKTYYDWSPDEALVMLKNYFNIKLPSGINFQFAYSGHGDIFIDERMEDIIPGFLTNGIQTVKYMY